MKIQVLGLCGSLRAESWNLKLLRSFLSSLDQNRFETRLYGSLEMPLMNEDLEKMPLDSRILELRAAVEKAQVIVFGAPEYNASITPAIKNAIDWGSRAPVNVWQNKVGVLLSASPGALGGARGLIHLRTVLSGVKIWVIPEQVQCPRAPECFDASGTLTSEPVKKQMIAAAESLATFAEKMVP